MGMLLQSGSMQMHIGDRWTIHAAMRMGAVTMAAQRQRTRATAIRAETREMMVRLLRLLWPGPQAEQSLPHRQHVHWWQSAQVLHVLQRLAEQPWTAGVDAQCLAVHVLRAC